ncbi:MAG: hypothetical protein ACRDJI_01175 [Actinomycetota bacterium]
MPDELPATIVGVPMDVDYEVYPSFSSDGVETQTKWRVAGGKDTLASPGNYAEQYLSITPSGRLLDFSTYPQYSDDRGETWSEVRTAEPLFGNEGSITAAPNGDIIAIDWYAEGGDRIVAFKYDSSTKSWTYSYGALHTPYADRPWLTVAPGPFTVAGETEPVPYLGVLRGGFPKGDPPYYLSTDGLHYIYPSHKSTEAIMNGTSSHPLPVATSPDADYIQPQAQGAMFPTNHGLVANSVGLNPFWYELRAPDIQWKKLTPTEPMAEGSLLTDSLGRLHFITFGGDLSTSFEYWMSSDGGQSWNKQLVKLPQGYVAWTYLSWDARTNAAAGVTAVAVHAVGTQVTQDIVYKFSTRSDVPELQNVYLLGRGDTYGASGLTNETGPARFDFASVAIFPDGRVATSFEDSRHMINSLAVEMDTSPVAGGEPIATSRIEKPRDGSVLPGRTVREIVGSTVSSGSVEQIQVALSKRTRGDCRWLKPSGRKLVEGSCEEPIWLEASGTDMWRYMLRFTLPSGSYEALARAVGTNERGFGFVESCCEAGRNEITFRVP